MASAEFDGQFQERIERGDVGFRDEACGIGIEDAETGIGKASERLAAATVTVSGGVSSGTV